MVMTVSRCIMARVAGSSTAITVLACPLANRARDRISTAIGVVRSPMPTRTAPLPSTCTSPPSTVAGWCTASSSPQYLTKAASANIGWYR